MNGIMEAAHAGWKTCKRGDGAISKFCPEEAVSLKGHDVEVWPGFLWKVVRMS
jgi:hypothetical protein